MTSTREHGQAAQRVKVGLVGLAAVILLIAFASAIMRTVSHESPVVAVGAPKADVVANMVVSNTQGDASEPLPEMGAGVTTVRAQSQGDAAHR